MRAAAWLLSITVAGAFGAGAKAAVISLVDRSARAVIVLPSNPAPAERFAGAEIARYVGRMSGAPLTIIEGGSAASTPAIVIGRQPDGVLGAEGYSLSIRNGRLHVDAARGRSVLYAAYDVLTRLGCRWLAPQFGYYGRQAEIVPDAKVVMLRLDGDVVEKPDLALRKLYVEEGLSHNAENLPQLVEWMAKSRFNILVIPTDYQGRGRVKWENWREALIPELQRRDIEIEVGGHGYQNYLNAEMEDGKLFIRHPEWFGMAGGKRVPNPGRVFCTSNPAAVDYLTENVVRYLAARPEITIFDFWPPDGARWCECDECARLGPPEDRQARLVSQVIAAARKRGVPARFECIAYAAAINPPTHPAMDRSVLIDFCPIAQSFEAQIFDPASDANARYAAQLQAWRAAFPGEISIYSYYRKYAWRSLPVLIPHYMQRDIAWYRRAGARGVSTYSEPGDWRTYELNHYTLARLAWHPDADVDAIVTEFTTARFGPNAAVARQLYQTMEDTVRFGCSVPGTSLKSPAEVAALAGRLQAAKLAFVRAAGSQDQAAAALAASVDYALRDLALQQARGAREAAAVAKQVDELVAFLQSHRGEGVFLDEPRVEKPKLTAAYALPGAGAKKASKKR